MKETQYKTFSLRTHRKNWSIGRPNVCEFELTFGCGLHCRHCYSDCYNTPEYLRRELNTKEVKFLLDKIRQAGVIWLCFTGGDPLTRIDFPELYSYAKTKGFIITVFTNGYTMNKEIAACLKKKPPFAIEMTMNAVTEDLYEKISGVKGSFVKTMRGIGLVMKAGLPLAMKTQVTRDNLNEFAKIKKFIARELGLRFKPSIFLFARLNGDLTPCHLRISPREVLNLNKKKPIAEEDCNLTAATNEPDIRNNLFTCVIGGKDNFRIDPYGNTFPCTCIREPKINLLKKDIAEARREILDWIRTRKFSKDAECRYCSIRELCHICPGKVWLEKGNLEAKIDWFCDLALKLRVSI